MKIRRLEVVAWVLIGTATTLLAADGTWIAPGGGAWSDTSKWQNQTVAEAAEQPPPSTRPAAAR